MDKISDKIITQVTKDHYLSKEYLGADRFIGLQAQIDLCLDNPSNHTFLEIGPGPGLLAALLKNFGRSITTVDYAEDLKPDYVAELPDLPFNNESYDVVCAFEVLEHISFDDLRSNIKELLRIARKKILISVPNQVQLSDKEVLFRIKIFNRNIEKIVWRKPLGRITNLNEHKWEIGHNGVTNESVIKVIKEVCVGDIKTFFRSPYFQFFVITK